MTNEHTGQGQERENDDSGKNMFHHTDLVQFTEQERHNKARHHEGHITGVITVQAEGAAGNADKL